MKTVTQMGAPIIDCDQCGYRHAVTRPHSELCGLASAFINDLGVCLRCAKAGDAA